jgi:glutathione peroxidase
MTSSVHEFKMKTITGAEKNLADYKGEVLLIVNVASKCGLTPQYDALEKLYKRYHSKGFEVLGFPANEFGAQEPGSNQEIQDFCRSNFGIEFPMFEKIVVKGQGQHPLYKFLTESQKEAVNNPDGKLLGYLKEKNLLNGPANDIKWNFEKFLVNKEGKVVKRFAPDIVPDDPQVIKEIEAALN